MRAIEDEVDRVLVEDRHSGGRDLGPSDRSRRGPRARRHLAWQGDAIPAAIGMWVARRTRPSVGRCAWSVERALPCTVVIPRRSSVRPPSRIAMTSSWPGSQSMMAVVVVAARDGSCRRAGYRAVPRGARSRARSWPAHPSVHRARSRCREPRTFGRPVVAGVEPADEPVPLEHDENVRPVPPLHHRRVELERVVEAEERRGPGTIVDQQVERQDRRTRRPRAAIERQQDIRRGPASRT